MHSFAISAPRAHIVTISDSEKSDPEKLSVCYICAKRLVPEPVEYFHAVRTYKQWCWWLNGNAKRGQLQGFFLIYRWNCLTGNHSLWLSKQSMWVKISWNTINVPRTKRYKPEYSYFGKHSTMGRNPWNSYFEHVLASMILLRMYQSRLYRSFWVEI